MQLSPKYFLYRHIRLDKNEPFYIGIGTQFPRTMFFARAYSKFNRNKYWKNIVGITDYEVEIIYTSDNYDEICEKEKEFILIHGRRDLKTGTLVNMTDGGELNYKFGPEVIKRKSEIMKGNTYCKGKKLSEETRRKMSIAQSARDYSYQIGKKRPEHSKFMSQKNIGNKNNLGKKHSALTLEKMAARRRKPIYKCDLDGNIIKEYSSVRQAAADLGVHDTMISMFLSGVRKHANFIFRAKNKIHFTSFKFTNRFFERKDIYSIISKAI